MTHPLVSVSRVLETCLYAPNLVEAGRFYEEVLGLAPFAHDEGRHIFYRVGQGVFLLFDPMGTSVSNGSIPAHGTNGPGHVAFAVAGEELEPVRGRLEARGVVIDADVVWPGGGRSIYLRDPAGNSVELTTPSIWGLAD